ncbi:MAG TPA: LysR family transcriptional regulator, partial [Alphaproteobacteria bacterium]|nr:LysR family transcriptional regulator [Alphaproteobacteria bacterium]
MPPSTPSDSALLDWTLIRSFVAVMQAGNLTQAAARLGLTQPTLGRHIREIERIAGETLFDRLPGGLRPTARAAALFERAEAMDAAAGAFGRALGGDPGRLSGTVRLT